MRRASSLGSSRPGQLAAVDHEHEVLDRPLFGKREQELGFELERAGIVKGLRDLDLGDLVAHPPVDADLADLVRPAIGTVGRRSMMIPCDLAIEATPFIATTTATHPAPRPQIRLMVFSPLAFGTRPAAGLQPRSTSERFGIPSRRCKLPRLSKRGRGDRMMASQGIRRGRARFISENR